MEGTELINRIQVRGNQVLKVQQVEETEINIEIQIRRKLILSLASQTTTPRISQNV